MASQIQTGHHLRIRRMDDRLFGEGVEQEHRLRHRRVHTGRHHPCRGSDPARRPDQHQATGA